MVLIVRVPDGPDLLCRRSLLLRQTYSISELSWRLCVFLWWSCYVGGDMTYSNTQVLVVRCVWVSVAMSCRVRN
jgi:hypothetical protein